MSALELFSLGIGPSSSHTVGPMRAGAAFRAELLASGAWPHVDRLEVELMGSLASTGIGHGTPDAVVAGLRGLAPEACAPAEVHGVWERLAAGGEAAVDHVPLAAADVTFSPFTRHPGHPNALTLTASSRGGVLLARTYLSVGGGFIQRADERPTPAAQSAPVSRYRSMAELLEEADGRTIAQVALEDEHALHGPAAEAGLDAIWAEMSACVEAGLATEGVLPGRLRVRRRAAAAYRTLLARTEPPIPAEWVGVYAMAVNEQNAAGGRVVTAPTNGAAGVLPAVLLHHLRTRGGDRDTIHEFLLTAAAIGSIIKANASISGAEAGCQGEVGSACAMAAAGLTAIRGGTLAQVENAAEIALEHHLGLTCDPVGGLVQVPCIERNAVAASTAITATHLALLGDGTHVVSLDTVIETMRQTGVDMSSRYKETSLGGLAVNVPDC